MSVIVLDTETTGLHQGAAVIQIASLTITHEGETEYEELMNPGEPIDPGASAVHGVWDVHVADKRLADHAIPEWWNGLPIQGAVIVGHNLPFDLGKLARYVSTSDLATIDTLYWARKVFPGAPNHKLTTLYSYTGHTEEQKAHDALGDVRMCRDILKRICVELGKSAYELAKVPVEIVWPFGKHRGVAIKDTPRDYLEWAIKNMTNLDPTLKAEVARYL